MEKEHLQEDEIICPYCNYKFSDSWEYGLEGEDSQEFHCDECDKKFYVEKNVSVSYTTKADCELNNEEHSWVITQAHPTFDFAFCKKCVERKYLCNPITGENFWDSSSGLERPVIEGAVKVFESDYEEEEGK